MLNLQNTEHELLAWSAPSLSNYYIGEHEQELEIENPIDFGIDLTETKTKKKKKVKKVVEITEE